MWDLEDTIVALASPPGAAARATIRVSGPETKTVLGSIFSASPHDQTGDQTMGGASTRLPHCIAGQLQLSISAHGIPAHLYYWPTSRSYTGQTSAELHLIGSPPLIEAALSQMATAGARLARPGEFTLRSFLAGHLDLVQAEAVLGVIEADDHLELQIALQQLAGGLSQRVQLLRDDLVNLLSDLEAGLDFVEEDIEFVSFAELQQRLTAARESIERLLGQSENRMQSAGRFRVLLAGLPNAGKSTLFNHLAGDEVALVSPISGTTRDYLIALCEWNGVAIELVDTAGWDEGFVDFDVMKHAHDLRAEQIKQADLIVWCRASDLNRQDLMLDERLYEELKTNSGLPILIAATKQDLIERIDANEESLAISCHSGQGVAEFKSKVAGRLTMARGESHQIVGSTATRCRESLRGACEALERARHSADAQLGDEIVALELRDALDALGQIVGLVYTDDLLDRIFSKFCIGK